MATMIMKKGARAAARMIREGVARTNTITITDQGLIPTNGIQIGKGSSLRSANAVMLGYEGDHNVTLLRFDLQGLEGVTNLLTNYKAIVIFKHEDDEPISVPLTGSINELLVPSTVTKAGKYQIHYTLQEKLSATTAEAGHLGAEDEAAFREIFISEAISGLVVPSGKSLIGEWTEDDVYNYNLGFVIVDDWEESGPDFVSSFFMTGLDADKLKETDQIAIHNGIDETYSNAEPITGAINIYLPFATSNLPTVTLLNTGGVYQLAFSATVNWQDEEIRVIYPVKFETSTYANSTVRKPDIQVNWTPGADEVMVFEQEGYEQTLLGIKLDSYVTAVNLTNLLEQVANDTDGNTINWSSYVIFSQGSKNYICPSLVDNNETLCWIPLEVTHEPGVWNVSVVLKADNHTFYNETYQLTVLSSFLKRSDFKNDGANAAPLYDREEYRLIDVRNKEIYVTEIINEDKKVLAHTASQIDANLAFIDKIKAEFTADEVLTVLNALNPTGITGDIDDLKGDVKDIVDTTIPAAITTARLYTNEAVAKEVQDREAAYNELDTRIDDIEDISGKLNEEKGRIDQLIVKDNEFQANFDEIFAEEGARSIPDIRADLTEVSVNLGAHITDYNNLNNTVGELGRTVSDIPTVYATKNDLANEVNDLNKEDDRLEKLINENARDIATLKGPSDELGSVKYEVREQTKAAIDPVIERLNIVQGSVTTEGSIKYEVNEEAKQREELARKVDIIDGYHIPETYATISSVEQIYKVEGGVPTGILPETMSQVDTNTNTINGYEERFTELKTWQDKALVGVEVKLPYVPNTTVANIVFITSKSTDTLATELGMTTEELNTLLIENEIISAPETTLTGEQVFEVLKLKNRIDNNTLYLIQEEE